MGRGQPWLSRRRRGDGTRRKPKKNQPSRITSRPGDVYSKRQNGISSSDKAPSTPPTDLENPSHHPWMVDPHCSSAMQTRQGTADLIYQTKRNNQTPKPTPSTIPPAKKIPRPSRPQTRPTLPPSPTDRPSTDKFKNRFPGPTGPLPKRTVRPSVSRAQPQPQNKNDGSTPPMIGRVVPPGPLRH